MAGETTITLVGNLTADPELRFTPSGAAVANFTVASTPRTFDRNTNEWRDGDAMFLNCAVWRQAAENVAESLQKGMRVIVQGRLKSRSYETREGERRTVFEIDVDEIGPALRYATAKVYRNASGGGGGGGRPSGGSQVAASEWRQPGWRRLRRRPVGHRWRRRRQPSAAEQRSLGHAPERRAPVLTTEHPLPTAHSASGLHAPTQGEHHHGQHTSRQAGTEEEVQSAPRRPDIDYKDTATLRKFISERGKIRARRVTGLSVQEQRKVAIAIKNAREVALLPYASTAR